MCGKKVFLLNFQAKFLVSLQNKFSCPKKRCLQTGLRRAHQSLAVFIIFLIGKLNCGEFLSVFKGSR